MRTWIGGSEFLKEGDVVVDWGESFESGGATLLVDRPDPVPELPTEEDTVILVTDTGGVKRRWCLFNGVWRTVVGSRLECSPEELRSFVTGFEVLASPNGKHVGETMLSVVRDQVRRETAKAVLDHIADEPWARDVDLRHWRREFGVEVSS